MSTYKERYEERKQKREEQSGYRERYFARMIESGKLDAEAVRKEISDRVNNWITNSNNYISNAQSRFNGENTSYRADASDWLSNVTTQRDNLKAEADSIKSALKRYDLLLGEDYINSVTMAFDEGLKGHGSVVEVSRNDFNYWSKWENEEAWKKDYDAAVAWQKDYDENMSYDLVAGQAEIDRLEKQISDHWNSIQPGIEQTKKYISELEEENKNLAIYAAKGHKESVEKIAENKKKIENAYAAIKEAQAQNDALKSDLSAKLQYYTLAKRTQDGARLAAVSDPESEYYDPDFEKYSQLGNSVSWENVGNKSNGYGGITVYDDLKAATLVLNEKWLGKEIFTEDMVTPKSGILGYIEGLKGLSEYNTENIELVNIFRKMEDKELKTLAYYLKKDEENGTNLAEEYVGSIKAELNARRGKDIADSKDTLALQYLFAVEAGLDLFFEGRDAFFSGADYIPLSATQYASGIIRENLAGEEGDASIFGSSWGQIGYDFINTTANMLPSILASSTVNAVLPGAGSYVGASLLGMSAAGNAKAEMLRLGYSKEQATSYGIMVGASEALLEKILGGIPGLKGGDGIFSSIGQKIIGKIDNALARVSITNGGKILKALAKFGKFGITVAGNMGDEALEEGLQTILEPWIAEIATNVDWDDPTVDEVLYSSLLGALSSIGFTSVDVGFGAVKNKVAYNKQVKEYGQRIIDKGSIEGLRSEASKLSDNKTIAKLSNKLSKKMSARNVGKLAVAIQAETDARDKSAMVADLVSKGLSQREAQKVTEFVTRTAQGYEATEEEIAEIEKITDKLPDVEDSAEYSADEYGRLISELESEDGHIAEAGKMVETDSEATVSQTEQVEVEDAQGVKSARESAAVGAGEAQSASVIKNAATKENVTESRISTSTKVADTKESPVTLESASKKYGAQAGAMKATYIEGQDIAAYDAAYRVAYDMGKGGVNLSYAMQSKSTAYLTDSQRELAHAAGVDASNAKAKERDAANKAKANGKSGRRKGIVRGRDVSISDLKARFNDKQGVAYKLLSFYAEVTGIDIVLYDSSVNDKGEFEEAQGKFKRSEDTIYIDINAGLSEIKSVNDLAKYTMMRTFSHEFVHFIEKWNPICYNEFRRVVFDTLTERGENVDDLIATKQAQSQGMGYDKASREVVAEAMTDILPDAHFAEELATKHKNIFYKLLDMLKEFVADLKAYFNSIGKNPSREANALKEQVGDSVKYLDHIVKLFDKVAIEAVENYQAAVAVDEADSNGLTDDEKGALLAYKSGGSYSLNAKLRDGAELNEYEQGIVDNLDRALEKLPTYKGEVYRIILFDGFGDKAARDAYVKSHVVGERIIYEAYTSTSTKDHGYPLHGEYVVRHIIQSINGRDMNGHGNNFENEVLFARDSVYLTDRIEYDRDGTPTIYLTEVANEQQTAETQTADRRGTQGDVSRDNPRESRSRTHTAEKAEMQRLPIQHPADSKLQFTVSERNTEGDLGKQEGLRGVQAEVGEELDEKSASQNEIEKAPESKEEQSLDSVDEDTVQEQSRSYLRGSFDSFDGENYSKVKLTPQEYNRVFSEALTWNADKIGVILHQTIGGYTYVYSFDERYNITIYNKYVAINIHERKKIIDDFRNRKETYTNDGESWSNRRNDSSDLFNTDGRAEGGRTSSYGGIKAEARDRDRGGYVENSSDSDGEQQQHRTNTLTDRDALYMAAERSPNEEERFDDDQEQSRSYLKKDEYPTYGVHWGIEEGVMSKADARAVWEAIANIQKRRYNSYPTTVNGEYFVEGDDVLMVVAADYRNPIVETIYKFNDTHKANISYAKELIINARGDPTWHGEAVRTIEILLGEEYVEQYDFAARGTDEGENRGGKGANSRKTAERTPNGEERFDDQEQSRKYLGGDDITDDKNYPKSSKEASAFLRSYANKTSLLEDGETDHITVYTERGVYLVEATGYLCGEIVSFIKITDKNAEYVKKIIGEFKNGTHKTTEGPYLLAESIRNATRRGSMGNLGTQHRGEANRDVRMDRAAYDSDLERGNGGGTSNTQGLNDIEEQNQRRTNTLTDRDALYMAAERSPNEEERFDDDQEQSRSYLKKDEYPTYGVHWGIEEGVISKADARAVWEAIANIQKRGYHSYPTTVNGEYFVEGDDVLMVVDVDYRNPVVKTIFKFKDNESYAKEVIINARCVERKVREAKSLIETVYGEGYVEQYDFAARGTDEGENRGGKGANSRADFEGEIQYQRRTNTLTDRDALYMAAEKLDESAAEMSEAERDALQIFKDRLSRLYDLQEERFKQGRLYKEQQFGASADREAAARTLNRMHVLDDQIKKANEDVLSIENKKVLVDVLKKAHGVIEAEQKKYDAEILKRYRDRTRNAAAIKKYRERIRKDVNDLSQWILKPNNKDIVKHVPAVLKNSVIPFLSSIDFTSKQQLMGGDATQADKKFLKRLESLNAAMKDDYDVDGLYSGYTDLPADFMDKLESLTKTVRGLIAENSGEFVINKMTSEELKTLASVVRNLKTCITQTNKFHSNAMFSHVYEAGDNTITALSEMASNDGRANAASNFVFWQQIRPAFAFERFGEGGRAVYDSLRRGQAQLAFNTKKIVEFTEKAYTDKEVTAWEKEIKEIKISKGIVKMRVSDIMSFYELSKQPDSLRQMLGAGMRVATYTSDGKKISDNGHALIEQDIASIVDALTPRQKGVADALQKFMQEQGGAWGNYVSVARFGEELFTNEQYFPINSDGRHLQATADEAPSATSLYALLNMSFTKSRNEKANNRIIIYSIFDVFANHMASMAQYNALALPVLDAIKWLNYQKTEDADGKRHIKDSVREQMDRVYGVPVESKIGVGKRGYAQSFVLNIIKAFSGTEAQGVSTDTMGTNALKRYNVAQVAYNLRVVVQQPLAITRAALLIDYESIMRGMKLSPSAIKQNIKEMREYSGIAAWKALGFYDVNISRGLADTIKHNTTVVQKIDEIGMWGAEKADTLTWAAIWSACKEEVAKKQSLKPGDVGFYEAVTRLFEDVVYKTQVVDSVLTKNEYLRSKGMLSRLMGSFMSEPTTTASMVVDTVDKYNADRRRGMTRQQAWEKNRRMIGRTMYVYAMSAVILAAVQAVADAFRDDDEYEEWYEKWLEAFGGNLVDEFMPFNKLPIFSDFYDLAKELLSILGVDTYGNPPQSVFMQWYDSLAKGVEILYDKFSGDDTHYTYYGGIYKLLQAVSGMSGLPMAMVTREIVTAWNNIVGAMAPSLKVKTYDPGEKNEIKYAYQDGYLSFDEAIEQLVKQELVDNENEAYFTVSEWEAGDGYSRYDAVYEAVRTGDDIRAAMDELTSHGYTEKDVLSQVMMQIGKWYYDEESDYRITKQQAIDMLSKYTKLTDDEITKKVNKWSCVVVTGIKYDDIDNEFMEGKITASRAIDMYVRYGGMTKEDATNKVAVHSFVKKHPSLDGENISYSFVSAYTEYCEPQGIDIDVFRDVWQYNSSVEGDKDKKGNTISGSKKAKVLNYINSLRLSKKQKDSFYYAFGYSASKIREAPWH